MPRVSVLVPVYNAATYLEQCLDSIKAQTLEDIEVLCVNDGSTDESPAILQRYANADTRFVVLNKPNGGYGSAMNLGLAHATGDYVAIVEPDDFIAPTMYEDLLSFATWTGALPLSAEQTEQEAIQPADIVKGSYAEYFDGSDGMEGYHMPSYQFKEMPRVPFVLDPATDAQIFFFHPSIWSALYRRAFLEEKGLRFLEIPGAGWADNPFMVDTLLDADRIVWVPRTYYSYRITSPGSSSTLSDYRMVFDRMRDMRELLDAHNASRQVWEVFYAREFEYIRFVRESGYPDIDPNVNKLIQETLKSMDPSLVKTSASLFLSDVRYFETALELSAPYNNNATGMRSSPPAKPYDVSVICLLHNDADYAQSALDALLALNEERFEILCVNCGSTDYTLSIVADYARQTGRIVVAEDAATTQAEGIRVGAQTACGSYVFTTDLTHAVNAPVLEAVVDQLLIDGADLALFDIHNRFCVDALRAGANIYTAGICTDDTFCVVPAVKPEHIAHFAFQVNAAGSFATMIRTDLLRCSAESPFDDALGTAVLAARTLLQANRVVYCSTTPFNKTLDTALGLSVPPLDPRTERVRATPQTLPAWLQFSDKRPGGIPDAFRSTFQHSCAEAFVFDLEHCYSMDAVLDYYNQYFDTVNALVEAPEATSTASETLDGRCALLFSIARSRGMEGVMAYMYTDVAHRARSTEQELSEVKDSATLKLGMRMRDMANRVIPISMRGLVRSRIARR